jgi:hypothetical protein
MTVMDPERERERERENMVGASGEQFDLHRNARIPSEARPKSQATVLHV